MLFQAPYQGQIGDSPAPAFTPFRPCLNSPAQRARTSAAGRSHLARGWNSRQPRPGAYHTTWLLAPEEFNLAETHYITYLDARFF